MPKKPDPKKSKPRQPKPRTEKPTPKKADPADTRSASVPVTATITNINDLKKLPQLAEELTRGGMTVTQVMPMSGLIAGSCPANQIAALNDAVPGVVVEREVTDLRPS